MLIIERHTPPSVSTRCPAMVSKKKSSNPLDAHRKAARSRELKKNREQREKTREVNLVQKDTHGLEKEIRQLQSSKKRSREEDADLIRLQTEVQRIRAAKEEYLAKHPDHRKFVYPREEEEKEQAAKESAAREHRNTQQRIPPRDPRRSVYYDAIFNPHGAPPPGMPYMEKPAEQWEAEQRREFEKQFGPVEGVDDDDEGDSANESESDDDEDDDSDDGILMPEGPPPPLPSSANDLVESQSAQEDDSSEDEDEDGIVMPKGPPPGPPAAPKAMLDGTIARPPPLPHARGPRPPLPPQMHAPSMNTAPPLAAHQYTQQQYIPPHMQPTHQRSFPPRPPPPPPAHRPVPPRPAAPGPPPVAPPTVITSAPVLRDLKKEATAFVPTALRKKHAAAKAKAAKGGLPSVVDAAPKNDAPSSMGDESDAQEATLDEKVDLVSQLKPPIRS